MTDNRAIVHTGHQGYHTNMPGLNLGDVIEAYRAGKKVRLFWGSMEDRYLRVAISRHKSSTTQSVTWNWFGPTGEKEFRALTYPTKDAILKETLDYMEAEDEVYLAVMFDTFHKRLIYCDKRGFFEEGYLTSYAIFDGTYGLVRLGKELRKVTPEMLAVLSAVGYIRKVMNNNREVEVSHVGAQLSLVAALHTMNTPLARARGMFQAAINPTDLVEAAVLCEEK